MKKNNDDENRVVLLGDEKETIIRFDQTPNKASVFTYNLRWQKHIENRLELKPVLVNEYGGKEYEIEKKRISMPRAPRAGRKLTDEQRKQAGIRLQKARNKRKLNDKK